MIKKTRRKELSKFLKGSFINDVLENLEKKGIKNKKGVPFSKMYISHVFNGKNENLDIELAICEVYSVRKEQNKSFVEQQESLLK